VPQSKPEELLENITRMQQWRQYVYFLEFVLVAIPATLYEFMTLFLLAGLAGSSPNAALQLFVLWIGGCMGIYALWSMYARLIYNKSVHTISELPWITLGCGIIANAVAVFYFIFTVTKPDQVAFVAFCLAFLAPAYVSIHWAFALLTTQPRGLSK
jgi:hypothetical protein